MNRPTQQTFADDIDRRIAGLPVSAILKDTFYRNIRPLRYEQQLAALETIEATLVDRDMQRALEEEDCTTDVR